MTHPPQEGGILKLIVDKGNLCLKN